MVDDLPAQLEELAKLQQHDRPFKVITEAAAEIRSLREQVAQERVFRGALMTIATGGFKSDKCRQIAREALASERHEDKEPRA